MFLPSNITLKFGDSGDFVTELQRRLSAVGAHTEDNITGFYDGTTVNSVSGFQSRSGLRADGIAGPETLRKLNGVMSGDTSGTSGGNQEEEEAKQAAADNVLRTAMLEQQVPVQEIPVFGAKPEVQAVEAAVHQAEVAPQPEVHMHTMNDQQMILQQQIQREALAHQQTPQASAHDQLTAMLLQQTAQARPAETQHTPAQHQPAQHQPEQHVPAQPAQAAAHAAPVAAHEAPAQEPKGIVGRALQKMDAIVQRLSDYFEKKLAPDVLQEVKQLGQVMMQNGVKEVAIPDGPEQARGPSLPARGPETQQQIPHRG